MNYEQITVETRGRVSLITLNRPEKLNAWTPQMMTEIRSAMDASRNDDAIGSIVITGAGRAFCAGADIAHFARQAANQDAGAQAATSDTPAEADDWVSFVQHFPKPTIAAVNGVAVGIGITQIMPFDIRIASEEARVGFFFVRMALVPELASSALLPQMVGSARALDWCLTGRLVPAQECREAGLVSEVVPAAGLLDRALELGEQLAANAASSMVLIRELLLTNATESDLRAVMRSEGVALKQAYASWEHREAISAFAEKRKADFSRRPA